MARTEDGKSHFDLEAANELGKTLINDQDEMRNMKIEMGRRFAEIVRVRVAELDSLGIFPQQPVVAFDSDGKATQSTQVFLVVSLREMTEMAVGENGYVHSGSLYLVTPDGEISRRSYFEKNGERLTNHTGNPAGMFEVADIGPKALYAIENVLINALSDPRNHRQAGE